MKLNTVLFKLPVSVALVVSLVAIAAGIGVHLASTQQRLKGARDDRGPRRATRISH